MIRAFYGGKEVFPSLDNIEIIKTNAAISNDGTHSYNISFSLLLRQNIEAFSPLNRIQANHSQRKEKIELWDGPELLIKGTAIVLRVDEKSVDLQVTEGDLSLIEQSDGKTLRDLPLGPVPYFEGDDIIADDINWKEWPTLPYCYPSMLADVDDDFTGGVVVQYGSMDAVHKILVNVPGNYGSHVSGRHIDTRYVQMPYFLEVVKRVFGAFGYDIDFDEFIDYEDNWVFLKLYVCARVGEEWTKPNPGGRLPQNGYNYAFQSILPRWTMDEFLDQVKNFLNCEFVYDEVGMKVRVVPRKKTCKEGAAFVIEEVLSEENTFQADVKEEHESYYENFGYDMQDSPFSRMQDLQQEIIDNCLVVPMNSQHFVEDAYVLYVDDDGVGTKYLNLPEKGMRRASMLQHLGEGKNRLKIVPVEIPTTYVNVTLLGALMGTFQVNAPKPSFWLKPLRSERPLKLGIEKAISEGVEKRDEPQRIEVAFLGAAEPKFIGDKPFTWDYFVTHSIVFPKYDDGFWAYDSNVPMSKLYNLSPEALLKTKYSDTYNADYSVEYTIRFVSKVFPDANSLFEIKGQRYVCKQLKRVILSGVVQEVIEGVFYRAK